MTRAFHTVHRFEKQLDSCTVHLMARHPVLVLLSVFLGMPLGVLLLVFALTTLVMTPIAWLCGWL